MNGQRMEMQMNVAVVLRAAAARVRQRWCQEMSADGRGGVCAVGAIWVATGHSFMRNNADWQVRDFVARALQLPKDGDRDPIPKWNDAPGQTAENVAVGLEYAALVWEQEHCTFCGTGWQCAKHAGELAPR